MLKAEQKVEIKSLSEQGLNISEIADRLNIDWKTVKKVLNQNGGHERQNSDQTSQGENSQEDNELTKKIFKKLNSGVPPREIIAQIGHMDLVMNLYEKWKKLIWCISESLKVPDPQIVKASDAWIESFEKCPDWHQKKAIRAVGMLAWCVMVKCQRFLQRSPNCRQTSQVPDPYGCFECSWFYSKLSGFNCPT